MCYTFIRGDEGVTWNLFVFKTSETTGLTKQMIKLYKNTYYYKVTYHSRDKICFFMCMYNLTKTNIYFLPGGEITICKLFLNSLHLIIIIIIIGPFNPSLRHRGGLCACKNLKFYFQLIQLKSVQHIDEFF